ncbi:MAG: alkaline phosphatase family protein [Polyangiales bacterium]
MSRSTPCLLALVVAACAHAPIAACPTPRVGASSTTARPSRVVLVSIDGLKPEYLLEADARHEAIPTLRALMGVGVTSSGMIGLWPTVTYPAHTTLVTGVSPAQHGVVSNHPFDPMLVNDDGWFWYASAIRTPTLWHAAHAVGKSVGGVYWPVTVGATEIDWNVPQYWRTKTDFDDAMMRSLATPGLADEIDAAYHVLPAEHRTDHERGNAAELILKTKRPDFMLVYFTDLDTIQHGHGPFSAEAYATLEQIDRELGRVVQATVDAGTRDDTTFVIVSDHGFSPIDHTLRPLVTLRGKGLVDVDVLGKVTGWRAAIMPAGGACGVYLAHPEDRAVEDETRAAIDALVTLAHGGIATVYEGKDVEALGGFPGARWVLDASDGYSFSGATLGAEVGPSGDQGAHGYAPTHA